MAATVVLGTVPVLLSSRTPLQDTPGVTDNIPGEILRMVVLGKPEILELGLGKMLVRLGV